MVAPPRQLIIPESFWREMRRTLVDTAEPLFREAFLIGAALGANEQPRDVGERSLLGQALGAIAAGDPRSGLAHLLELGTKDRYPGVDDNFMPIPGPDGLTALPFDLDEIVDATDEFIRGYSDDWWESIETTTRDRLRVVMRRAAAEGLTIEQVMREVEPLFGRARAMRIAVSETTNLMGQGAQLTYQRAGFGRWIWRTVRDSHVDLVCDNLARQSDPQFGGTPFPMVRKFERAHINCRCWPVPAGEPSAQGQLPQQQPAAVTVPRDTTEMHTVNGKWTASRQALHDDIVSGMLRTARPVPPGEQPRAYVMGGGPASGKSTVISRGQVQLPENLVRVDSDAIKLRIPEYQRMVEAGDTSAAAFAHEESSYISKRVMSEAAEARYNVLLDGTGDTAIESLTKKVEQLRAGGQRVVANYVSLDTDLAVQLSERRAAATGRRVPIDYIRQVHESISRILPEAIERNLFDELYLYDTNIANTPRLVLSQVDGRTVIHSAQLWDDFLRKAPGARPRFEWEAGARRRGRDLARRQARQQAASVEATVEREVVEASDRIRAARTETAEVWLRDGTRFTKAEGKTNAVEFTLAETESFKGGRMLHNHPSSNSFSPQDFEYMRRAEESWRCASRARRPTTRRPSPSAGARSRPRSGAPASRPRNGPWSQSCGLSSTPGRSRATRHPGCTSGSCGAHSLGVDCSSTAGSHGPTGCARCGSALDCDKLSTRRPAAWCCDATRGAAVRCQAMRGEADGPRATGALSYPVGGPCGAARCGVEPSGVTRGHVVRRGARRGAAK